MTLGGEAYLDYGCDRSCRCHLYTAPGNISHSLLASFLVGLEILRVWQISAIGCRLSL
jgi:hypothetical protein